MRWKHPKGLHSKIRLSKAGHRKKVKVGYKSPKDVRFLHRRGLKIRFVNSFKDLEGIDKGKEGVIISGSVGLKKKIELIKKTIEKKITVLNIKNPDEFIKNKEEAMKLKKDEKEKEKKTKEKKEKEKVKEEKEKKEEKGELAEKIEKEEKEKEKKEKDKLLTKRV